MWCKKGSMEVISILEKISKRYKISMKELEEEVGRVPLPYNGVCREGCKNLKYNHGLYSQCGVVVGVGEYCVECGGIGKYGTINDRLKVNIMDYKDPYGNKVKSYREVLKEKNIPLERALEECKKNGIILNKIHIEEEVQKKKRGRPKKVETIVSDSDNERQDEVPKKKRGRPKKEKTEIVSNREEEEKEEITEVTILELNGKKYLRTENDELYDEKSHELIGLFNKEEKKIILVE